MKDQALYDRLVSRIRIDEKTGCWLWTGPVRPSKWPQNRYGIMSAKKPNGKWGSLHTHRAMMIAVLGPLTREQCVCHRCDIPLCVNPEHLFIGTMGDNIRDSRAKNRHHEAQKTHCERGHPLFGDNLVISHQGGKKTGIRRVCKICELGRARLRAGWPEDLAFTLPPGVRGQSWKDRSAHSA